MTTTTTTTTSSRRPEERSVSTEVRTEDVLAALSAFPAPPCHIPPSPAVSSASSSYFSLPRDRDRDRDRDVPPSAFAMKAGPGASLKRSDSGLSVGSVQIAQSGKLSVRVNGRDVEADKDSQRKRDSGSGSSTSSGLLMNGSGSSAMLPSPMSGRVYYTAPNSPLPPGVATGAGPGSGAVPGFAGGTRSSSLTSLNIPSSAYPRSTSPSSAYPSSSASSFAYSSRHHAYPNSSPYTPSSTTSARAALSMLSTPASASASTSSSPSSIQVPISAVAMSPIEERDERERVRSRASKRQSSLPPTRRGSSRTSRTKADSESGSEIGSPPSVPLPPLPLTTKTNSSFSESTPTPTPGPTSSSATPNGPPSVKSLPSLRSRRKTIGSQVQEQTKKENRVSASSKASSPDTVPSDSTRPVTDETPKSKTRTIRGGLRIDIPPTLTQERDRVQHERRLQQIERPLGSEKSGSSAASPLPRELSDRRLRERAADGEKVNSPTASLFSIASGGTTRSGMSSAQSLRTRISGMLEGLEIVPGIPNTNPSTPTRTTASVHIAASGSGKGEEEKTVRKRSSSLHPPSTLKMNRQSGDKIVDGDGLTATEDVYADLSITRSTASTPYTEKGHDKLSPLEMSRMDQTMKEDARSHLTVPSLVQVPPLSDIETDEDDNERMGVDPGESSESLLRQFPPTPTIAKPPPSSFTFPTSSSHPSLMRAPSSVSGSDRNVISRTISQSRRKPLPPAPRHHASLASISTHASSRDRDSASLADGATDAIRGRTRNDKSGERDGATSPDIATILSKTPRPALRSKSLSARSRRSSKSLSTRSSSIRSSVRERARPSLPSERERELALARFSAASTSSASPSHTSSAKREGSPSRRSGGSEVADVYGGIEEDADANVDYGIAIARHRGGYDLSPSLLHVDEHLDGNIGEFSTLRAGQDAGDFYAKEAETMLEPADNVSPVDEESDSDIDLHTPLPHIFLRDGVLSPQSKVLASMSSSGSLSMRTSFVGTGRESVASYTTNASFGSALTKSGLFKDERDTDKRRRRHRDGKLLREGLGLTTGLGWSDSEDEDAPSPFTHRVSSMALSRSTSAASVRSASSKKSQFFLSSTSSTELSSTLATTLSARPRVPSSRSSRQSEPHPLSKSYSSVNLSRQNTDPHGKQTSGKAVGIEERRSMSPTPTSSSTTSLPFPPTPRDDARDEADDDRSRMGSRALGFRAKTQTERSLLPKHSVSSLRPRAISLAKSKTPSFLPSTAPSTPRPLRLPTLHQQKQQEVGIRLQPGQPTPNSGSLLGYNRHLHDQQRAQQHTAMPKSAPSQERSSDSTAPALSPMHPAKSAPSSFAYGSRRPYGSAPVISNLHPSFDTGDKNSRLREPSPSRISAPMNALGKPRTGTGMAYRQSSMPTSPIGSAF